MAIRKNILIKGVVQGVSYRKQTVRVATGLGVTGWVRNRSDGTVEACLEGEEEAVDALTAWCALGPPRSRVDVVLVSLDNYSGHYPNFTIKTDKIVTF